MRSFFANKKIVTGRSGQSLMELLIGMAIGAILIIGSAAIIVSSLQSNTQVANVQAESQLGSELLSNVKTWAAGNWNSLLAIATGTSSSYYMNTASSPFTVVAGGTGFSNGYSDTRSISVNSSQVSSTQSSFPMLISGTYSYLATVAHGGLVQNASGDDIIFTSNAAGTSKLNWELESYNSSTGNIVASVNIPTLSGATVIYMFYDNSSINTFQGNVAGTWNSNYAAVWHLGSATAVNLHDSTGNGNTLTNTGVTATSSSSLYGGAASFNGSSYLQMPSAVVNNYPATVEVWFNPPSTSGAGTIAGVSDSTFAGIGIEADQRSSAVFRAIDSGGGVNAADSPSYFANTWNIGFAVFNNANSRSSYINNIAPVTNTGATTLSNPDTTSIGTRLYSGGLTNFYTGLIDEVRILNVALSSSWILTEYNNDSSPSSFYSISSASTGSSSTSTLVSESINLNDGFYHRYFYVSDVYRDASGNATTTASGNFYDPSTKLITVVVTASSTPTAPVIYSTYVTRSIGANTLDQKNWSGGIAAGAATFVSSTFSTSTGAINYGANGLQIGMNSYLFSKAITVNSADVSGTEANFPMLFSGTYSYLAATSSGGNVQNGNGYDIDFASDPGGANALNWEMESYASSTGNISAWINVPTLTSSTVIYMFYDSPTINTFQGSASATWNSNYLAIYHLPNGVTLNASDSTANANNETSINGTTATSAGQIGGAAIFNGTSNFIGVANSATLHPTNITISAWINTATSSLNQEYVSKFNNQTTNLAYDTRINSSQKFNFDISTTGTNDVSAAGATTVTPNTWYYVANTYDGTTMRIYVNGVLDGSTSITGSIFAGTSQFDIGQATFGGSRFFNGTIDEVNIASVALSPSWILTAYNNQNSPSGFYTITTNPGGGTGTLSSQPFDTRIISGIQLNSFLWQGSQPGSTTAEFQFAVSNASTGPWTYVGPDGTTSTYFSGSPGTPISLLGTSNEYSLFNGYRYFSYLVFLNSSSSSATPVVNEVSVNWSP